MLPELVMVPPVSASVPELVMLPELVMVPPGLAMVPALVMSMVP